MLKGRDLPDVRRDRRQPLDGPAKARIERILLLLITVSTMGIDLCLPSLPAIGARFGASVFQVQLTLSSFLLGFGLMQAVHGPLSERYGRRPVMLAGLLIATLGNGCSVLSPGLDFLVVTRFIAGAGSSVIWVLQRSIMRDVFLENTEMTRFASRIAATWAITLAVAPILGGYIQNGLGWRTQFGFMATLCCLSAVLVWRTLPETKASHSRMPGSVRQVLDGYLALTRDPHYMKYVLGCSLAFGVIMAYNVLGPFIFMGHYHLSPVGFGWLGLLVSVTYFLTTLINSRVGPRFDTDSLLVMGSALMMAGGGLLLALHATHFRSPLLPMPAILACIMGMGLACPNATVGAMSRVQADFGLASSLFGCIQMLTSTAITGVLGACSAPSLVALGGVFIAIGGSILALLQLPNRIRRLDLPSQDMKRSSMYERERGPAKSD